MLVLTRRHRESVVVGSPNSVEPTKVLVKGSDAPDVQLQITAPKDAAIGEYRIHVKGTPATGESTSTEFKVKVVAP